LLLIALAVGVVVYAQRLLPPAVLAYLGIPKAGSPQEYEMVPVDAMETGDTEGYEHDDWDNQDGWDDDNWDDNWGDDEFSQVSLGSEDRVLPTSRDEKKINDRFNSNR